MINAIEWFKQHGFTFDDKITIKDVIDLQNDALETAAKNCELMAGEMFTHPECARHFANAIRLLKKPTQSVKIISTDKLPKNGSHTQAPTSDAFPYPIITADGKPLTREDVIDGLQGLRDLAYAEKRRQNASFVRFPDMELVLKMLETHGLPGPENTVQIKRKEIQ